MMVSKAISSRAHREKILGKRKCEQISSSEITAPGALGTSSIGISAFGQGISGMGRSAFGSQVNCVNIKIPGRKLICFGDVSETETIGTLTEKIAGGLGVDKRNWGFYVAGPREFLPDSEKVREINHNKNLHFLPRTVIR